jgi:hypothetical protein
MKKTLGAVLVFPGTPLAAPSVRAWSHAFSHRSDPGIVALCRLTVTNPVNFLEARFWIVTEMSTALQNPKSV